MHVCDPDTTRTSNVNFQEYDFRHRKYIHNKDYGLTDKEGLIQVQLMHMQNSFCSGDPGAIGAIAEHFFPM